MTVRRTRSYLLAACAIVAVFSGVYFGLFSCGGYAWHKDLHRAVEAVTAGAWILSNILVYRMTPMGHRRPLATVLVCVGFYFAMHEFFVFVMAIVAPFSIAPPESFSEWSRGFLRTWSQACPC